MLFMNIMQKNNLHKNLGIQILRMLLCFWVVLDHCLSSQIKKSYNEFFANRLHVPCFILISFFFSYKTITGRNCIKIKQRFERLLIPHFIFPIIIFLINNLSFVFFKISIFGYLITLHDLLIQFIIGRSILDVFWFQFYLIMTTLLFIIISLLLKEKFLFMLLNIYFLSYILRYSNLNYYFFLQFSNVVRFSVGQIVEVMPLSVTGSVLASLNIFSKIQKYYRKTIYFSIIILFCILKYNIFTRMNIIAFDGIILDIGSIFLFILFYLIPINFMKYPIIRRIIDNLTNYTQGIYALHLITKNALYLKFNSIKNGDFTGCIIIYCFSYLISFVGEKITKKSKLVYLFI